MYMHHSGTFPLAFKSPKHDIGGKNCQKVSQGKPWNIIMNSEQFIKRQITHYKNKNSAKGCVMPAGCIKTYNADKPSQSYQWCPNHQG